MKPLDEVIQALEHCTNNGVTCHECPYCDRTIGAECLDKSRDDALHYLKEHQALLQRSGMDKLLDVFSEIRGDERHE